MHAALVKHWKLHHCKQPKQNRVWQPGTTSRWNNFYHLFHLENSPSSSIAAENELQSLWRHNLPHLPGRSLGNNDRFVTDIFTSMFKVLLGLLLAVGTLVAIVALIVFTLQWIWANIRGA